MSEQSLDYQQAQPFLMQSGGESPSKVSELKPRDTGFSTCCLKSVLDASNGPEFICVRVQVVEHETRPPSICRL